jgi:hypothetical protein
MWRWNRCLVTHRSLRNTLMKKKHVIQVSWCPVWKSFSIFIKVNIYPIDCFVRKMELFCFLSPLWIRYLFSFKVSWDVSPINNLIFLLDSFVDPDPDPKDPSLFCTDPDPDTDSGSCYHQTKRVTKTLISNVLWLLIIEEWCKCIKK